MEYIDAVLGAYEPLSEDVFQLRMRGHRGPPATSEISGGGKDPGDYSSIKAYIDSRILGGDENGGVENAPVSGGDGRDIRESNTITRDDYDHSDIFLVTPIDLDNPLASGAISEVNEAVLDIIGADLEDDDLEFQQAPIGIDSDAVQYGGEDDKASELTGLFNQFKL